MSKKLLFAVFVSLFTTALYFSGLFVMLTPLPLFLFSTRVTPKVWVWAILGAVGATVSLHLVQNSSFHGPGGSLSLFTYADWMKFVSVVYFGYFLLISILLTLGWKRQWEMKRWGLFLLFVPPLFLMGTLGILQILGKVDWIQIIRDYVSHLFEEVGRLSEQTTLLARIPFLANLVVQGLPGLLFGFTTFTVGINLWLARPFLAKARNGRPFLTFAHLELPHGLIWGLIGAGFAYFLDHYLLHSGVFKGIGLNVFLVVANLYLVQGFSILIFFLHRYGLWLRLIAVLFLMFFFQLTALILVGLGLADIWLDFRRLARSRGI